VNKGHFELFQKNPNIDVLKFATFRSAPLDYLLYHLRRTQFTGKTRFTGNWYGNYMPAQMGVHATEVIAEMTGFQLTNRKLEVFLTPAEDEAARSLAARYSNPVAIHVTSNCSANQNWPKCKWEELVRVNRGYTFLQMGGRQEVRIDGTVDLRGETSLRLSVGLLKYVKSFIGVVSFLAHATNAVGTPGVVLFGPSSPAVWGHSNNINISRHLRCAPCIDILISDPCPYGAPCLSEITVEQVSAALAEQVHAAYCLKNSG
jgi:ADP-heptose:LPS heptosyltransferase